MPVTINGTTGIAGPDGSASTPAVQGTDANTGLFYPAADTAALSTGGSERMRIDSSGNLGLGVTPESMLSVVRAVRVGQGAMLEGRSNSTVLNLSANQYISAAGQRTYITTGEAAYYEQIVGQHRWFTAPSGTAGNAITFTQAMMLDASGNLGIGTSSPSYLLHAAGTNPRINVSASSTGYAGYRASNTSGTFQVAIDDSTGSNYLGTAYGRVIYSDGAYPLQFATNATERMRIDSSGNVGIGVTPPTVSQGRLLSLAYSGSGISVTSGTSLDLTNNAYYNSGWKYGQSGKTARIQLSDDQIYFGNATTGTAGNAITFTQTLAIQQGKTLALEGASLQNGTGITFPATQSASSDANTLDDYEEGTWTPTLTGASSDPTVTYTTQTGQYTKVGRVVHVQCSIVPATYSGGSGVLRIAGLPFTSGSSTFYVTGSAYLDGVDIGASRTWATSYVAPGVSHIRLITSQNNGAASDVLVGGVSAGDNIIIGITYMV